MRALDIHCHPITKEYFDAMDRYTPSLTALVKRPYFAKTEAEMADDFRRDEVMGMIIAWDSETSTGDGIITNDWVASLTDKFPEVFLPGWAVIDPWKGKLALRELEHAITELGLTGAKFMPAAQAFYCNDQRFYPIWELCQSLKVPVLIHTGTTGLGYGTPGGLGIKLKYAQPIPYIDDVAADFPDLTIIAAHPGWPWTEDMIAMLIHKSNVYFEVSGWRPKYLPEVLKREIGGRLQDKVMFGSDYPGWNSGQCLDELEQLGFKEPVLEKLFYKNAIRILGFEERLKRLGCEFRL